MMLKLLLGIFVYLGTATGQYNYDEVLSKSILFYEAERSGDLPANNRIDYRGDSALGDRGNGGQDLTGGWYDAGDHVKFGFPMAFSTTTLAWGILEFRAAYEAAGQYSYALDSIRWPLDYFIKAHVSDNEFYGQVGDGNADHSYWGRPEDMIMARPAWSITPSAPGADLAAETAAALAAGYLVFRDSDAGYAANLLDHARRLYTFAYNNRGIYSQSISNAAQFYSSSSYVDELAWGAAWLYRATNEQTYLNYALEFADTSAISWAYDWNEKIVGYQLLLFSSAGQTVFQTPVEGYIRSWMPGGSVTYTPQGLAWRQQWGPNRYAANSAFIALVAAKYNILTAEAQNFARSQIHYMLGDTGKSFVVGFGNNPPQQPHHRSSSCPDQPNPCDWDEYNNPGPNYQILYGALVGGPDQNDNYNDARSDYISNEVACDYNAGFQGAVAGLRALTL
uniref:Endoglucanase n=1 Tax=Metaphire hilgendorfi TaxID=506675 RepID=B9A7E3_METHI|nr:beta-1,4-endoglucanase [Metaphire hilgendorfi]